MRSLSLYVTMPTLACARHSNALRKRVQPLLQQNKCSGETDFKCRAIAAEQLRDLCIDGFLRRGDEAPPVILGVFPDDFDQV